MAALMGTLPIALAFGAGIIQNSERGKGIQALVLTPTRELAEQVAKNLKHFSKYKPLSILAVYGGVSINPQQAEDTALSVRRDSSFWD
jgi:ATP-dependent RNA helicase DeaD